MKEHRQRVHIITGNAESGDSLREMIQATGQFACVVAPTLASLNACSDRQNIAVIFLDRSVEIGDVDRHGALLDGHLFVTFGNHQSDSAVLASVESRAHSQLRETVESADLMRLFNRLKRPGQEKKREHKCRPVHLYRGLVGDSDIVQELKAVIERAAPSKANILILGETGTGKEVVARNIHYRSTNSGGPFVPVNCSAIPAELLESELFGHKKGAFTGAVSDRVGRFELASGGTLFLDEIGDMPLVLQVKLLRVLEERIIYPLGSDSAVPMTARLVAATHRDLEKLAERGTFRADLFYRLNVVPITVPPLRDRKEDISFLARELSCRLRQEQNVSVEFTQEAINCIQQYDWPGNVRELANLVERLTVLYPDGCVDIEDLPSEISGLAVPSDSLLPDYPKSQPIQLTDGFDLKEYLQLTEAALIRQALNSSGGVVTRAAELLHLRRTTLTEKVKRLGLGRMIKHAS